MNKNIDKNNLNDVIGLSKKILKIVYILLIVVGIYVILRIFKELKVLSVIVRIFKVLVPLFLGIIIAWLLNPFVKCLETKNVRHSIGAVFAYILLVGFIILIINAIIPLIYNEVIDLVDNIPNIFSDVKTWGINVINKFDNTTINAKVLQENFLIRLDEFSSNLSTSLPSIIINGVTTLISSIGTFIIGLVIGFFLLLSSNSFSNTIFEIIPKRYLKSISELFNKINKSLRNYVNGALIDTFVVFMVSSIAFAIIGLKAPLLFGLFCGLMNVIPYAGPYIGGAPAVIVGFSQGTGIGFAVLIAIIIIQAIEGNLLQTLIISKTTKLNPVTIIIGLLIFGHFFGIIGMLLSTPIIGVCKVILKYFDEKYDLLNFN